MTPVSMPYMKTARFSSSRTVTIAGRPSVQIDLPADSVAENVMMPPKESIINSIMKYLKSKKESISLRESFFGLRNTVLSAEKNSPPISRQRCSALQLVLRNIG